jgi:hypothetical protein
MTMAVALVAIIGSRLSSTGVAVGQSAGDPRQRLTIPFLANATKRADLDFMAAECDLVANGAQMVCTFRQMFLTPSSIDATTCMITTNGYERTFRHETDVRWMSQSAPNGDCGVVETTTLEDGGGTRWVMTIRTTATRRTNQPECRAASPEPEVYDSLNMNRKLPCTSIQPGAIER